MLSQIEEFVNRFAFAGWWTNIPTTGAQRLPLHSDRKKNQSNESVSEPAAVCLGLPPSRGSICGSK